MNKLLPSKSRSTGGVSVKIVYLPRPLKSQPARLDFWVNLRIEALNATKKIYFILFFGWEVSTPISLIGY